MSTFTPGQAVNIKSAKSNATRTGQFVAQHPSAKGVFLEVAFVDGKTGKFRASQVTAA